jgi:hypothetical protein
MNRVTCRLVGWSLLFGVCATACAVTQKSLQEKGLKPMTHAEREQRYSRQVKIRWVNERNQSGTGEYVAIPTYPSNPATSVTLQHDPQTGGYKAGRVITEEGKDGKPVSKWAEIQPTILK